MLSTRISMLGRGPASHAGLYHYGPYAVIARIVPAPRIRLPVDEAIYGLDGHWPLELQPPEAVAGATVSCRRLKGIVDGWGVDMVFLDGIEPYEPMLLECMEGLPIGVRMQGTISVDLDRVEAVVFDVFPRHIKPEYRIIVLDRLEETATSGVHQEVIFHTDLLDTGILAPFLERVPSKTPIHIEYMGVASKTRVDNMVERLRRRGFHYVYVRDHREWIIDDTICPRCGATVIARHQGFTRGLGVDESGRCSACGEPIPVRLLTGSPGRLWRTMYMQGMGVYWIPASMLVEG